MKVTNGYTAVLISIIDVNQGIFTKRVNHASMTVLTLRAATRLDRSTCLDSLI